MSDSHTTILALESSTKACSVALSINGEIKQIYEEGVNLHSTHMLGMVDELLKTNELLLSEVDAIACGVGPGGFTGLRIGVGIAQGLAFSNKLPVVAVSSLDALAAAALEESSLSTSDETTIYAGLDARMAELYWCQYRIESGQLQQSIDYQLEKPENFEVTSADSLFIGNAWEVYQDDFSTPIKSTVNEACGDLPQAKYIAKLAIQRFNAGETIDATELAPLYVRNDIAKKSTKNVLLG